MKSDPLDLALLRSLLAVVEAESITVAAQRLGVTQPAVSKHISALEKRWSTRLLHRDGRGARPTAAGRLLVERARSIADKLSALEGLARESEARRQVRLAMPPTLVDLVLVSLMKAVAQGDPGLELRVAEGMGGQIGDWVRSARAELGIVYMSSDMAGLAPVATFGDALHLVVPPDGPFAVEGSVVPAALHAFHFVLPGPGNGLRMLAEDVAARFGFRLDVRYEIAANGSMRHLVREGLAVSILPWSDIAEDVTTGRLRVVEISGVPLSRSLAVVRALARPPSPEVDFVIGELCAALDRNLAREVEESRIALSHLAEPEPLVHEPSGRGDA